MEKLRSLIIRVTEEAAGDDGPFDPMHRSQTAASLCMNIFKGLFLPEDTIPIVPEAG
jgi:hypothetical protein